MRDEEGKSNQEQWYQLLTNQSHPAHQHIKRTQRIWKHVPGDPRCKLCSVPLAGPASPLLRLSRRSPAKGNPLFCNTCELWVQEHPGGTEVEMTLFFADVRGSTALAETMAPASFAELMHDFYRTANKVLIKSNAWMMKPAGDEIIALYLPVFAHQHTKAAVEGALEFMVALGEDQGHSSLRVGGGLHTGVSYIGTVGVEGTNNYDLNVLGDVPNVTSRLASVAAAGEVLISDDAYLASGLDLGELEHRTLTLKGREAPLGVRVLSRHSVPV